MKVRYLILTAVFFFNLSAAQIAHSLSCAYDFSCDQDCRIRKEFNNADSVFLGEVLSVAEVPLREADKYESVRPFYGPERGKLLHFSISKIWKGAQSSQKHTVTWFDGPTLMEADFSVGDRYIVFASETDHIGLVTGSGCRIGVISLQGKYAEEAVRVLEAILE